MAGDILGILHESFILWGLIVGVILIFFWEGKRGFIISLFLVAILAIGYFLGGASYENRYKDYRGIFDKTKGFTYQGSIEGTIIKILYRKERSVIYLLNFDNFDNFDKNYKRPFLEEEMSINVGGRGDTIFIEVPSNLSIYLGDRIVFHGKIQALLTFPLVGYHKYAFFHGGYGYAFVPQFEVIKKSQPSVFTIFQNKWEQLFKKSFPREVSGIALGMTIGSTKHLTEEVKDSFLLSGITHILVVSGSNIAFLILVITILTRYLYFPNWLNSTIIVSCIVLYVCIVGGEIPVLRATMMGILGYLIASSGLKTSGRALFGLVLLILTVIEPLSPLYDAGYGLSFGATLGIIVFQGQAKNFLKKYHIPESITVGISLTIGATLGSIPVLLYHFGTLPVYSLITNIIISGLLGWILLSSTIFGSIALIGFPYLKYLGILVYIPIKIIIYIAGIFSTGPILTLQGEYAHIVSLFILGAIVYYFLFEEKGSLYSE